jgi:hypothetical protein
VTAKAKPAPAAARLTQANAGDASQQQQQRDLNAQETGLDTAALAEGISRHEAPVYGRDDDDLED